MQSSFLPTSYGKPSHKRQGAPRLPPIRLHQTTLGCSSSIILCHSGLHYICDFFGSFCLSFSTGSKRSPRFSTRARTSPERNLKSSAFFFLRQFATSSQVTGVETVGSSLARSE